MALSLPVLQYLWDEKRVLTLEMIDGFQKQISKKEKNLI